MGQWSTSAASRKEGYGVIGYKVILELERTGVTKVRLSMRLSALSVVFLVIFAFSISRCDAARTVLGTFISAAGDEVTIKPDGEDRPLKFRSAAGATVLRGQTGGELRKAKLAEFGAGDRVVVVLNEKGLATSLKAYYAIAQGTVASVKPDKIFFQDGRSVKLRPGMPVVFGDGLVGKAADLRPGAQVVCRVNPVTNEAWTIIVKQPKGTKVAIEPYKPNVMLPKPTIKSVTYSAPPVIRPRDWIKVVVTGTPGGRAVCQVKGLIPRTVMQEISPGTYVAHVQVPSNKVVRGEPLVAYLTVNGIDATPVQASKLITVTVEEPETLPSTPLPSSEPSKPESEPTTEQKPEPEVPQPSTPPSPSPAIAEQPKPSEPSAKAPVVITSPPTGQKIKRVLTVTGTAEPGSNIMITVNYTNQRGGILNLSGQVTSQLVAVGPDGQFKMGPIPLEGPLATKGLVFTIQAFYPDAPNTAATVIVFGDRD